jgi:hypothetical protein
MRRENVLDFIRLSRKKIFCFVVAATLTEIRESENAIERDERNRSALHRKTVPHECLFDVYPIIDKAFLIRAATSALLLYNQP